MSRRGAQSQKKKKKCGLCLKGKKEKLKLKERVELLEALQDEFDRYCDCNLPLLPKTARKPSKT